MKKLMALVIAFYSFGAVYANETDQTVVEAMHELEKDSKKSQAFCKGICNRGSCKIKMVRKLCDRVCKNKDSIKNCLKQGN